MDVLEKRILETASTSVPPNTWGITLKNSSEMESMRRAGAVVASTIAVLCDAVQSGMRTIELDALASREIRRLGARAAFKGYRGFPATICTSINEEIVHGIPGNRVIHEGDLVKMDVGAVVDGFIGDAAVTVAAGDICAEARDLIEATRQSLEEGITAVKEGARVGDIGAAIQSYAEKRGYGVVREFVGHGVGRALHEEPQVPNYGTTGRGPLLRRGMAIAIEPMLNLGDWRTRILDDHWTVVTADGKLSAHFEHTVAITDDGVEVLTRL